MLRSQIEHCATPVWYSHFRPITFDTLFVHLTPDFLAYLSADGVVLPPSLIPSRQNPPQPDSSDSEVKNTKAIAGLKNTCPRRSFQIVKLFFSRWIM